MSFIDKLPTDTSNAFVQLLQRYQDEGRLEQEFARRQQVYPDRSAGHATVDKLDTSFMAFLALAFIKMEVC